LTWLRQYQHHFRILYFAGKIADAALVTPDASQADLIAIARFVMPFISDEGLPKTIDW
jgi:hypothetical protein